MAMEGWFHWIHVNEISLGLAVISFWVGFAGIVLPIDTTDLATAFFVGYSIDSLVDFILTRVSSVADIRAKELSDKYAGAPRGPPRRSPLFRHGSPAHSRGGRAGTGRYRPAAVPLGREQCTIINEPVGRQLTLPARGDGRSAGSPPYGYAPAGWSCACPSPRPARPR